MKFLIFAIKYGTPAAKYIYRKHGEILLLLFVIANIWQKLLFIDQRSIWGDEAFSIWMGIRSFEDAWHTLTHQSGDAPLYFLLMNIYVKIFGIGNFSVRFLSILFSTATVAVLFYTGRKFINLLFASALCVLFITSSVFVHYSLEVRPYALVMLLASLSIYFYISLYRQEEKNALTFVALGIVNALLFYTHFLTFLLVIVQALISPFLFEKNIKKYWQFIYSLAISGILVLPWLSIAYRNMPVLGQSWQKAPNWDEFLMVFYQYCGSRDLFYAYIIVILFALVFLLTRHFSGKYSAKLLWLFIALGFLPVLFAFLLSYFTPVYVSRYFLYAGIGFFMAVAYAYCILPLHKIFKYSFLGLFAWQIAPMVDIGYLTNEEWKGAMPFIKENRGEKTITFVEAIYQEGTFSYHFNKDIFLDHKNIRQNLHKEKIFPIRNGGEIGAFLLAEKPEKVILVQTQWLMTDPENTAAQTLDSLFTQTAQKDLLGVKVTVYE